MNDKFFIYINSTFFHEAQTCFVLHDRDESYDIANGNHNDNEFLKYQESTSN